MNIQKTAIKGAAALGGAAAGAIAGRYGVVIGLAMLVLADKVKGFEEEVTAAGTGMLGSAIVTAAQPEVPISVDSAIASGKTFAKGVMNGLFVDKLAPSAYTMLGNTPTYDPTFANSKQIMPSSPVELAEYV